MSALAVLFLVAACDDAPEETATSAAAPADALRIEGPARVVDGDTLYVNGVKIRLNGIDAPEYGAPRHAEASRTLRALVAGRTVTCRLNGEITHDRRVGVCFAAGQDLAAGVIASGNALDCGRYSGGRYRPYETAEARRNIRQARYC